MRIEEDLKLGFKDVLFRPKRSTLSSRSQVELHREFRFRHTQTTWRGIPIIAANMDTVGTFTMAKALASYDVMTAIHKHYTEQQWQQFVHLHSSLTPGITIGHTRQRKIFLKQIEPNLPLAIRSTKDF